mmetsp:Transcript_40450/g.84638  ORF Transcript_40450/g.84638 Transcript_40450/m.84638 type:complete len:96 (-) Transcript_40450:608-895(-)
MKSMTTMLGAFGFQTQMKQIILAWLDFGHELRHCPLTSAYRIMLRQLHIEQSVHNGKSNHKHWDNILVMYLDDLLNCKYLMCTLISSLILILHSL